MLHGQRLTDTLCGVCQVALLPLLVILLVALAPSSTSAQDAPELEWTEPGDSERLADSPSEIRLGFSDALDPARSRTRLLDRSGNTIRSDSSSAVVETSPDELLLPLPESLPDDVYTVAWQATGTRGESERTGYFAFEVGDAGPLPGTPPESRIGEDSSTLPVVSRIAMLLGVMAASGLLFTWIVALRPALQQHDRPVRRLASRVRLLIGLALLMSALGAGIGLLSEASRAGIPLADVLTGTTTGSMLMLQLAHLILFAAALAIPVIWRSRSDWRMSAVALAVAGAALVPLAMSSHSGQQLVGSGPATANQWLHLTATSVWTGGILAAAVVTIWFRSLWRDPAGGQFARRIGYSILGSIPVLGLSGLYSFHLNTGNLAALRTTEYGEVLTIKLILSGVVTLIAVIGLMSWRLRLFSLSAGRIASVTVPAIAVLLLAIAGTGAALNLQDQNARDAYLSSHERLSHEFVANDIHGTLYVTPGLPGNNRVTLDLSAPGSILSDTAQPAVRLRSRDVNEIERQLVLQPEDICTADGEVIDSPVSRFERESLDLSMTGRWEIEVQIRRIDGPGASVPVSFELEESVEDDETLDPPLRFSGVQATVAVLSGMGIILLSGTIFARYRRSGRLPDVLSLVTVVLLVFTVLALWNGRITHTPEAQSRNPIPRTVESVEAGRDIYLENCAVCHGKDARGDGENAPDVERPPADLTEPHMDTHPAGDIAYWIRNGIEPAMPGTGDGLTDEEVWHLVNYLRSLRHPVE